MVRNFKCRKFMLEVNEVSEVKEVKEVNDDTLDQ